MNVNVVTANRSDRLFSSAALLAINCGVQTQVSHLVYQYPMVSLLDEAFEMIEFDADQKELRRRTQADTFPNICTMFTLLPDAKLVQLKMTVKGQQVGRIDDQDTVLERLRALSAWNQCAVVIDLMYGLPDQTTEIWKKDVELLVQSGVDGADLYQLDVFEKSDLALSIQKGRLSPAATTQQQTALFAWGKGYLDAQGWKRLSFCHWARNNRERSLYNTLARGGVHLFPFGCGAGGHVDGVSTMLHRALPMYEKMVSAGQKPLMFLQQESPYARIADRIQAQLNQCRLDLEDLARMDSRLSGLQWLGDLWEEYGLWKHNGYLYHLTEAGQFWEVNMTQTVLECVELLMEGAEQGKAAEARVAEQG